MMPRLHPDPPLSPLVWKTADTYSPLFIFFWRFECLDFFFLSFFFFFDNDWRRYNTFGKKRYLSDICTFRILFEQEKKIGESRYQFSAREKMAASISYPSRYLTPFWNSARAEINRERNVSRKIRDVTRTRSTAFPCFVFELEQGLCLWVILFRIERASERATTMCNYNSVCWM